MDAKQVDRSFQNRFYFTYGGPDYDNVGRGA